MAINTGIGMIGVAKQTNKSTAAQTPTFVHGLTGGKTFKLDRSVSQAAVACGVRAGADAYVESITPGLDYETFGYADVLGLYLLAVMGNVVTTASGTFFQHVITLGSVLPYLTIWGRIGTEYTRTDGCKIDQLEMEFEGTKPLDFGITAIGLAATMGLESFPGTVDPSCFDGYFVPTGGSFKIDTASDTPTVAPILSGSLQLSNALSSDQVAGSAFPYDVSEGKLTSSGKCKVKPDDAALYRKLITGTGSGTTPTAAMVYGSFEWNFKHSVNANYTLKVEAEHVPFTCEFPDVSPDGGAAEFEFSFDDIGVESATGSPVTVTVVNATSSY